MTEISQHWKRLGTVAARTPVIVSFGNLGELRFLHEEITEFEKTGVSEEYACTYARFQRAKEERTELHQEHGLCKDVRELPLPGTDRPPVDFVCGSWVANALSPWADE